MHALQRVNIRVSTHNSFLPLFTVPPVPSAPPRYPEFNKLDSYSNAVTNKTRIVRKLLEHADENTVVVITSDHGQVDWSVGHTGPRQMPHIAERERRHDYSPVQRPWYRRVATQEGVLA